MVAAPVMSNCLTIFLLIAFLVIRGIFKMYIFNTHCSLLLFVSLQSMHESLYPAETPYPFNHSITLAMFFRYPNLGLLF